MAALSAEALELIRSASVGSEYLDLSDRRLTALPADFLELLSPSGPPVELVAQGIAQLAATGIPSELIHEADAASELDVVLREMREVQASRYSADDRELLRWSQALEACCSRLSNGDLADLVSQMAEDLFLLSKEYEFDEEKLGSAEVEERETSLAARSDTLIRDFLNDFDDQYASAPAISLDPARYFRTQVQVLDLGYNWLSALPKVLFLDTSLEEIRLENNRIEALPELLEGEMPPSLRLLDVSDNKLTELPEWVKRSETLADLNCTNNDIDIGDTVVLESPNLTRLFMANNGLKHLDFARLPPKLATLDAGDHRLLSSIRNPASLADSLQYLDLSNCGFEEFPDLSSLRSLRSIDLAHNEILGLPEWLATSPLEYLDIQENLLSDIPLVIADMHPGVELIVDENPLPDTFFHAAAAGMRSLVAYVRSVRDEQARPCREAKIVLVGEGNVGKTSIVNRLCRDTFVDSQPTTHGIEVSALTLPWADGPDAQFHVWDFGGQPIYRVTHQFYFSQDAVFLVVWRPREGPEQNAVEFWIDSIARRVGKRGRIVLVSTHADEGRLPRVDFEGLRESYGDLIHGYVSIDSKSGKGFDDLVESIRTSAALLAHFEDPWADTWTTARDWVTSSSVPFISRSEADTGLELCGITPGNSEAVLRLFSVLGQVIYYFDDPSLCDLIVRDPELLARAVSYVLEDSDINAANGIVHHQALADLWSQTLGPQVTRSMYPFLLRLMERHEITYRLDEASSLVAALVPRRPGFDAEEPSGERSLSCSFAFDSEPVGLVSWLTCRLASEIAGRHWATGFLATDADGVGTLRAELQNHGQELHIVAAGSYPLDLFSAVRRDVEFLMRTRWPYVTVECYVNCRTSGCVGRFRYAALRRAAAESRRSIECSECFERQEVRTLLEGFEWRDEGDVGGQLLDISNRIDQVLDIGRATLAGTDEVRMKAGLTADGVIELRGSLEDLARSISAVAADAPRLFSVHPVQPKTVAGVATADRHRLRLWCEFPGQPHPAGAGYVIDLPKEWVRRSRAVLILMSRLLRVVPVVGRAAELAPVTIDDLGLDEQIDLMEEMALAAFDVGSTLTTLGQPPTLRSLGLPSAVSENGWEARCLKQLLTEIDPAREYERLSPISTTGGSLLWLCPEHRDELDPGLPAIP